MHLNIRSEAYQKTQGQRNERLTQALSMMLPINSNDAYNVNIAVDFAL